MRPEGAAVLLTAVALCGCSRDEPSEPDPAALRDAGYRADPRVAALLLPCPVTENRYYDRDTTDMLPVLLEKLEAGQLEPLRRAKEELAELGAESVAPLRRFFERNASDAFASPLVENALDVVARNPDPGVRPILLAALQHPQTSVRRKALNGMTSGHARPEDYELLREHVTGFEDPNLKSGFARAMHAADPVRAETEFAHWLAEGEQTAVGPTLVALLSEATDPGVAALCGELWPEVPVLQRALVAAPAARAGDAAARAFLLEELGAEDARRRTRAIQALDLADLRADLVEAVRGEPDSTLRVLALEGLAGCEPWDAELADLVRESRADPEPLVRSVALEELARHGDPEALDQALEELGGSPTVLQEALSALREPLQRDPDLARRAYERLLTRHELESHRPIPLRTATYKAMGLVPLAEAAAFLRGVALEADAAEDVIESIRAHEWIMIQAANTGLAGRTYLARELAGEEAPRRRLDLIMAVATQRDELARETLLDLADGGARSPYELLYVAERLTRVGPSRVVAPALRRAYYDVQEAPVRVALQCLLWRWY